MMIATNNAGVVLLHGSGPFPSELNGVALVQKELSDEEYAEFSAVRSSGDGTTFDGKEFKAIERPPVDAVVKPTLEQRLSALEAQMRERG